MHRQRGRTAENPESWLSRVKADVTSAAESGILCGAWQKQPERTLPGSWALPPCASWRATAPAGICTAPRPAQIDARQLSATADRAAVTDLTTISPAAAAG